MSIQATLERPEVADQAGYLKKLLELGRTLNASLNLTEVLHVAIPGSPASMGNRRRSLPDTASSIELQKLAAEIAKINDKGHDEYVRQLRDRRTDLRGLPLRSAPMPGHRPDDRRHHRVGAEPR